jgi:hypothetical protein
MRRDSGFADLTFADLAFADLAFDDPRARAGNSGFCNRGRSFRTQIRHGIFFTGLGSSPNTFAAVPPRMLRRPLSLRNGRS